MQRPRIKSPEEIELCRASCQLAANTLLHVGPMIKAGITTNDINDVVHQYIVDHGAIPSPLNYKGFPKSVCTSINEVVCHGIPSDRVLVDGDIINVDVTAKLDGFHGDTSATFYVGSPTNDGKRITEITRVCLQKGIEAVIPGQRLSEVGAAIEEHATAHGCSVVRDYVGHGVGREFHEPPQVSHFRKRNPGSDPRFQPGWVFTIEPMINLGKWQVTVLEDNWTAVTRDGSLTAQFEHTVLVTDDGVEILTERHGVLANSEDV